ncbi:MAG: potassium channel family protein [Acidimicrobiia bacterium]
MSLWEDAERREAIRGRFEERMAIPVLIAAALLTVVTLILLLVDLSDRARLSLLIVDGVIWFFFVCDYAVRFTLAIPKKRFAREEWLDLVLVVLPIFQPLRLAGAFVRLARVSAALERVNNSARSLMGRHRLYLALAWGGGLVTIASVVTPVVEPDNSKIKTVWDGLWWSIVTTTTVGYGDMVPESAAGRVIAFLLMLAGIGIIGLLTANIAALFLEPDPQAGEVEPELSTEERLDEIDRKLQVIIQRLDAAES